MNPDSKKEQAPTRRKDGTYQPGQSGNPGGRSGQSCAIRKRLTEGAAAVVEAVLEAAQAGDMQAARLVLERIAPSLKPQALPVVLPEPLTGNPAEMAKTILQAAAAGHIAPDMAQGLLSSLAHACKIIETVELENRIQKLERLNHANTK